jgi:hypothetical protein
MKWLLVVLTALSLSACAGLNSEQLRTESELATAQVGVVNHTANYIYSASVNGVGGGNTNAWTAGIASMCCTSIPRVWYPGMKVRVRWDMPIGHTHNVKEKIVEVEEYERPGSIYLHFFPNDEVRVIVTNIGGPSSKHPIPPPVKPANAQ